MITREQLVDLFDSIGENTDWDLAGPMRWGYYFTDPDRQRLERVVPLLEADDGMDVGPVEPATHPD